MAMMDSQARPVICRPAGSIAAASTSRYPDENHCKFDFDACSALDSVGSATLSTVPSRPTARTDRLTATSAHHLAAGTARRHGSGRSGQGRYEPGPEAGGRLSEASASRSCSRSRICSGV